MAKNLMLGSVLAQIALPLPKQKKRSGNFTSTMCYTLEQAMIACNFKENEWNKLEKIAKNLFYGPILAPLAERWALIFFYKFYLY